MNTFRPFACLLVLCAAAFPQTAYQRCVSECISAGGDPATCGSEICNPADTTPDVTPGTGNPLFLPSYELRGAAPAIDGSLMSRDGDPSSMDAMDEWKEACSRTLILSDSTHTQIQLFLVNSRDTLYVGITYQDIDNSNGCGVRLLFDQGNGAPGSLYHGPGDMRLTAPNGMANEQGCALYKAGGGFDPHDQCWNGSAWIDDGGGQIDFQGASYFYNTSTKIHHYEYAVPLHNGKPFSATNSDLNVNFDDAIGFYIEVTKGGAQSGIYHWIETNGDPDRADVFPFWGKIQLSIRRDFFTFYTGRANSPPTIDGSIAEAAWNGAYQRELVLSDFHYMAFRSKIWCLEDSAQNSIYIGVRVFDKIHSPQDYCQVYFEEDGANTTNPIRNYYLDPNAENAQRAVDGNQYSDLHWDGSTSVWAADPSPTVSQSGKAGEQSRYADYEFKVARSGGMYNIDIPKGGLLGLLVRYHDGNNVNVDLAEYLWEYTTNNDAQLLDFQNHPYIYIATGWANLQLGGPYIQIIRPATTDNIHGTVPIQISSGTDSLKSVVCFLSTDTTKQTSLTYQGNGTWTGSLDATNVAAGSNPMLIVRAVGADNLTYERVLNKVDSLSVLRSFGPRLAGGLSASVVARAGGGLSFLVHLDGPASYALEVFTISGCKVWSCRAEAASAGTHLVNWNPAIVPAHARTYILILTSKGRKVAEKFTGPR